MLVKHDDPECEFSYTKGAERSVIAEQENGGMLVSMKTIGRLYSHDPVLSGVVFLTTVNILNLVQPL